MRRRRVTTATLVVALAVGVTTLGPVATTEAKQPAAPTDKSSADRDTCRSWSALADWGTGRSTEMLR